MRIALVLASLLVLAAAGAGAGGSAAPRTTYYVALGDSLAAGTQPGRLFTEEGYADQLYALERERRPGLRLAKLACPGETTTAFRRGGRCPYPRKTQLAQATSFLRSHRGRIALVTIDIGANDFLLCAGGTLRCGARALASVRRNLPPILRALRRAAGPRVRIVGMDYYAPLVARWTEGRSGQAEAAAHVAFVASGNALLRSLYRGGGVRVARVEGAFATRDFATSETIPEVGRVPRNVAQVCRLTWMCSRGDIHPNAVGYRVIAGSFVRALR